MFDIWIHNNCLLSDVEKEYRAKDFLQSIFDELFELVENLTDNIHVTISGEPRYLKIKDEVLLDTIIHEGFHAMLSLSGLGYILEDVQEELEEALVRAYENIMGPFIKEQYRAFYKK